VSKRSNKEPKVVGTGIGGAVGGVDRCCSSPFARTRNRDGNAQEELVRPAIYFARMELRKHLLDAIPSQTAVASDRCLAPTIGSRTPEKQDA
jgi:hypothetical protein